MMRTMGVLAAMVLLAGCQRLEEAALTEVEKINRAFTLPTELAVTRATLAEQLAAEPAEAKRFEEEFAQLLAVRALTCRGTAQVGRFDSVADVRAKLLDTDCFKRQDAELAAWVGLRRLARVMAQPPLRPLQKLPAKAVVPSVENVVALSVATGAGVALARNNTGKFTTLDLNGGKPIHTFSPPGESHRQPGISPNGRLGAVSLGSRALQILDLETGSVVWASDKYGDLVAWLPEVEALVLTETGGRKSVLVDLRSGASQPYVPDERGLSWALDLPGAPARKLVGSPASAAIVDHARDASGRLGFTLGRQWRLSPQISAYAPLPMRGGKLIVYRSHPDLAWLDLESGQGGTWATGALRAHGFNKLDEQQIFFHDNRQPPGAKLLHVENLTIATTTDLPNEGYPVSFAPRGGYARNVNGTLVVYTQAQAQDPQPLDRVVAEANLQEQLRKLDLATRAEGAPALGSRTVYSAAEIAGAEAAAAATTAAVEAANASGLYRTNRPAYLELLGRQVRMLNTASAMRDGLPRDVVERTRAGQLPLVTGAAGSAPAPMLADVPANAEVAVLGVYQAERERRGAGPQPRTTGTIRVTLGSGSAPLVLVLTSYEPVRWVVQNSGGRKVAAVLLSSYHASEVVGLQGVQVLRMGQHYAYKVDSPEYLRLKESVRRYVAPPIRTFQGGYEGREFSVGGS